MGKRQMLKYMLKLTVVASCDVQRLTFSHFVRKNVLKMHKKMCIHVGLVCLENKRKFCLGSLVKKY